MSYKLNERKSVLYKRMLDDAVSNSSSAVFSILGNGTASLTTPVHLRLFLSEMGKFESVMSILFLPL